MATYFVAVAGDGTHDGSSEANAFTLAEAIANSPSETDVHYMLAGAYAGSGLSAAGDWYAYESIGSWATRPTAPVVSITGGGASDYVFQFDSSNSIIHGIHFKDVAGSGPLFDNFGADGNLFVTCRFSAHAGTGRLFDGTTSDGLTFLNCEFDAGGTGTSQVYVSGTAISFFACRFRNMGGTTGVLYASNVLGLCVDHCWFYDLTCPASIFVSYTSSTRMFSLRNNSFAGNASNTWAVRYGSTTKQPTVSANNLFYNLAVAFYKGSSAVVRVSSLSDAYIGVTTVSTPTYIEYTEVAPAITTTGDPFTDLADGDLRPAIAYTPSLAAGVGFPVRGLLEGLDDDPATDGGIVVGASPTPSTTAAVPPVTGDYVGLWSLPVGTLRNMVAYSGNFQTWTGTATFDDALDRVYEGQAGWLLDQTDTDLLGIALPFATVKRSDLDIDRSESSTPIDSGSLELSFVDRVTPDSDPYLAAKQETAFMRQVEEVLADLLNSANLGGSLDIVGIDDLMPPAMTAYVDNIDNVYIKTQTTVRYMGGAVS